MVKKQFKILIVDDEPDIAMILKLHLEDIGYQTVWAENGTAALKLIHSGSYPLVLLDIRMPGISGLEVLKQLQTEYHDTSVIMMTAHGTEDLAVECMKEGAVDYVAKPFKIDDLLNRIERALEHHRMLLANRALEKEKDDFFYMLSHDLKNPITAAIGSIDIMREGRLGPVNVEQIDYLQSAIESCEEVVTMIDNLLDMHRFETGKMQTRTKPVNPYELLEKAVKRFAPAAQRDGVLLTITPTAHLPEIAVDSTIMDRVLSNLIGNALKYTYEEGRITLTCHCVECCELHSLRIPVYAQLPEGFANLRCFVRIAIKDSGIGIPPEELAFIFEQYSQAKNSSYSKRGGAGLGLAFCRKAVENFHGCIWAESDGETGSEFIILLPCHPGDWKCGKKD